MSLDHRGEVDLLEGPPQVLRRKLGDFAAIRAHVDLLGRRTDRVERVCDGHGVLAHRRDHQINRAIAHFGRQPTHHAQIDQTEDGGRWRAGDEDVAWVRIGVEEAVLEDHLDDHPDARLRDARALMTVIPDRLIDLGAREELEREHLLRRRLPVHLREAHARMPVEVLRELDGVVGLLLEVELAGDRAVELIDEPDRRVEARFGNGPLHQRRERVEDLHVARNRDARAWTLDLDDHLARAALVAQDGAVYLADRRGGERRLVEALVDLVERTAQGVLDSLLDVGERDRVHLVLELFQLGDPGGGDHVRAGGRDLPEFHEGGAEVHRDQADPLRERDPLALLLAVLRVRRRDGGVDRADSLCDGPLG